MRRRSKSHKVWTYAEGAGVVELPEPLGEVELPEGAEPVVEAEPVEEAAPLVGVTLGVLVSVTP